MFADNPFLVAAEDFTSGGLMHFSALRSFMEQSTDGSITVRMGCHPSAPPSEFGYMEVRFSFDLGHFGELQFQREMTMDGETDADWLPEDGPTLQVERVYHCPSNIERDVEEIAASLEEVVEATELAGGLLAASWVDVVSRRASRALLVGGRAVNHRIEAGFSESFTLRDVHTLDWRDMARQTYELVCDLAEAATGQRPVTGMPIL